jgi:two-component system, cell cycle sensor histidine kinase PleC
MSAQLRSLVSAAAPIDGAPNAAPVLHPETALADVSESDLLPAVLAHGLVLRSETECLGYVTPAQFVRALAADAQAATAERDSARRALQEAHQQRSRFFANLSHELKTPLTAIVGYSDLIRSEVFGAIQPSAYRDYIEAVYASGLHLVDLLDAVLNMARLRADEMELRESLVSPQAVVHDVVQILKVNADRRNVTLRARCQIGLPEVTADERILRQIVINLLSNAIKFSPEGADVSVSVQLTGKGALRIEVKDKGPGISPDQIEQVMRPFRQIDQGGMDWVGTGLGLPLVKAMTEAHDGHFQLISSPGKGTRAVVTLPSARVQRMAVRGSQAEFQFTRRSSDLYA